MPTGRRDRGPARCAPAPSVVPSWPVRDPESLVSMLDDAASLLDQLGTAGTALAPQMLSAWKDTVTSHRTMLGLLDPAATDPAGHARAATATVTDLEQLAERYDALHATADPTALLTPVAAHVRMATAVLRRESKRHSLRPLLLQPGRRQRPRDQRPPGRCHRLEPERHGVRR